MSYHGTTASAEMRATRRLLNTHADRARRSTCTRSGGSRNFLRGRGEGGSSRDGKQCASGGKRRELWVTEVPQRGPRMGGAPVEGLWDETEHFSKTYVRKIWSNLTKNFKSFTVFTTFGANCMVNIMKVLGRTKTFLKFRRKITHNLRLLLY